MLPDGETYTYEDTTYVNPEVSLNEQNAFIDRLRNVQQANNSEIKQDTYNLGTAVPSNLGGLVGGEGYFTSRYQTPQTNSLVADLRATARAQALNDILKNEQVKLKQQYNNAYKSYQRRAAARSGGSNTQTPTDTTQADVETNIITPENFYGVPDTIVSETDTHYIYTDPKTGKQEKVSKEYMNKIYDENGNITDDGMVILDTRRLLGL